MPVRGQKPDNMSAHTNRVLGYFHLLDIVSKYASCPLGREHCLSLRPMNELADINRELDLVSEARLLEKTGASLSFYDIIPVGSILLKASAEGAIIEPEELLKILNLISGGETATKTFYAKRDLCPLLWDMAHDMPDLTHLSTEIKKVVSSNGTIKESASTNLKKIRKAKTRQRLLVQQKLKNLQKDTALHGAEHENIVTIRDGRYVLSLKTSQKGKIHGIIHDYSNTKATCFIEPLDIVDDNNRIAELIMAEKEEEFRILLSLTEKIKEHSEQLKSIESFIGNIDGLFARAHFAEHLSCIAPEIGADYPVDLKQARNPLLLALALEKNRGAEQNKHYSPPVPVDIHMGQDKNILIISGPNGGGKTVTLKTLGLLALMTQAGMHIPVKEGSCLPVFSRVMADIGDDQDIQTGLSTFSAHIAQLKNILDHSDGKALVLIDEPGMATDPAEGVAITMAAIDALASQRAFIVISTHLNRLKVYGFTNERAVNASVELDPKNNCPSYRLQYGTSGISHAIDVAKDMGLPQYVINQANKYLGKDDVQSTTLIEQLNTMLSAAEREKQQAERIKKRYLDSIEKTKTTLEELRAEKRSLITEKRIEADHLINEAQKEFKQIITSLKNKQSLQANATGRFKDTADRLITHFKQTDTPDNHTLVNIKDVKEGQYVYLKKLNQQGQILSVDQLGKRAIIGLGNIKITAEIKDLEIIKNKKRPVEKNRSSAEKTGTKWYFAPADFELNLVGFRVEEAINLIDKTIDKALVEGKDSLKIVHGFGTGRLRKAIRSYLKKIPYIKAVSGADLKSGGEATTIVKF